MRSFLIPLKCLVVTLAAVFLACPGEPEDPFFYSGTVYDETGSPLASATVRMGVSGRDRPCYGFDGDVPAEWVHSAETDVDGRYTLRAMRYQVENPAQAPRCLFIEATRADAGVTSFSTQALATDTLVPPLHVWTVQDSEVSVVDAEVRARPGSLPAFWATDTGPSSSYYARGWAIRAAGDREVLWSTSVDGGELRFPTDLVESTSGGDLALESSHYGMLKDRLIGAGYGIRIGSPSFHLAPGRTPVSRGGRCVLGEATFEPCPSTDGQFEDDESLHFEALDRFEAPPPKEFVIEFPAGEAQVDRIVIRGHLPRTEDQSAVLEGRTTDGTWVFLLAVPKPATYHRYLDLPQPSVPVSAVRLRYTGNLWGFYDAEELSVFGR